MKWPPEDYVEAAKWSRKAAEQGDAISKEWLAKENDFLRRFLQ
jgi:TPR repeat protein|tara:strand:+ start:139 stop:267 length:129 start_codon:yes stop_codon:yes gene_type:complete